MNKLMAGIDLHSNNVMIGIVDENGQRLNKVTGSLYTAERTKSVN